MEHIDIKIRSMSENDFEKVATLASQLGYPSSVVEIKKRWAQISEFKSENVFVLILPSDEVIGFAHVGVELGITNSARTILRSFIIDQNWRNKGLGANFLKMVEDEMKGRGFLKMRIGSQVKRTDAHRFYRSTGYQLLKVWNVFEKEF